jgi:RNA polymerase sigma-70 factor (ECF subfamily)
MDGGQDIVSGELGARSDSGETSLDLLERAKAGDRGALDQLVARYLPRLRRWASGRLPRWARDIADTEDLVQESMLQTFKRIDRFEVRHEAGLQAYLRQAVMNRIRDDIRRRGRRPSTDPLDSAHPDSDASPLEIAIGVEALERYEKALQRLRPEDRAAIVARIEMNCSNEEIAAALNKPSPNAARMAVERALVRLAEEMRTA